jgi:putative transposase
MSTSYPSNLSDAEWECLQQYLPPPSKRGRPPIRSLRSIFDAIFYVALHRLSMVLSPRQLSTVANGLLSLPAFATRMEPGRSCCGRCTRLNENGKEGTLTQVPKAGDSQSVKTVEESPGICGYDAHKHIKGRKRHILVDTLGIPISIYVTPADTHDTRGARCLLAGLKFFVPRLKKIWADSAYRGQELATWCQATGEWELEVVERPTGTRGFSMVPTADGS